MTSCRVLALASAATACTYQRVEAPPPIQVQPRTPLVECLDCPVEPYASVEKITLATSWSAACREGGEGPQPCDGIPYEIAIRCVSPTIDGQEREINCERVTTNEYNRAPESPEPFLRMAHEQVELRAWDGPASRYVPYEGPLVAEVDLRDPATGKVLAYRSPTVWVGGDVLLACVGDLGHMLVPCSWSGVRAEQPLVGVVFHATRPDWEVDSEVSLNGHVITDRSFAELGGRRVPLFSLADAFPQFRTGTGVKPATYDVRVQLWSFRDNGYVDHLTRAVVTR